MRDKECAWNMGTDCQGEVKDRAMFQGQINVKTCDEHYTNHIYIMSAVFILKADIQKLLEDGNQAELFAGIQTNDPEVFSKVVSVDTGVKPISDYGW